MGKLEHTMLKEAHTTGTACAALAHGRLRRIHAEMFTPFRHSCRTTPLPGSGRPLEEGAPHTGALANCASRTWLAPRLPLPTSRTPYQLVAPSGAGTPPLTCAICMPLLVCAAATVASLPSCACMGILWRWPVRIRSAMASGWSCDRCRNLHNAPLSQRPELRNGKQMRASDGTADCIAGWTPQTPAHGT